MLTGKGMWLWELERIGVDVPEMVRLAQTANLQHVLVKVTDGEYNFPIPANDPDGSRERLTYDTIRTFQDAGITVWGWGFVYGSDVDLTMQAHRLASRARQFDLPGLVIDAEDVGQRQWSTFGAASRARIFMETLLEDLAGLDRPVLTALSSYRFPSVQERFPFAAFMNYCDLAMPQVYWVARGEGDSVRDLQTSFGEYRKLFPDKPYIPVGAAYGEYYGTGANRFFWSATPGQVQRFLKHCRAMGFPAVNFWSWQHARYDTANERFNRTELWDAIATFSFAEQEDASPGSPEPDGSRSVIEVRVDDAGYHDGAYTGPLGGTMVEMSYRGQPVKYAATSDVRGSVWAAWVPDVPADGTYEIAAWIPGVHGTTRRARYFVHGVLGKSTPVSVELDQTQFADTWVPLGEFTLDTRHPQCGVVNLSNQTGETGREVAFAAIRWQVAGRVPRVDLPEPGDWLADGFDSPVGTPEQRHGSQVWPGDWFDATGFGRRYRDSGGGAAYHTGADLNLNAPHWNMDAGKPVYAPADGVVTFAGSRRIWGNILIIRHDPLEPDGVAMCSRLAHLATMTVSEGQHVTRGERVGTIGRPTTGTDHLHFDLSPTDALLENPGDWPGMDRQRLLRDYVDPAVFIREHRPGASNRGAAGMDREARA